MGRPRKIISIRELEVTEETQATAKLDPATRIAKRKEMEVFMNALRAQIYVESENRKVERLRAWEYAMNYGKEVSLRTDATRFREKYNKNRRLARGQLDSCVLATRCGAVRGTSIGDNTHKWRFPDGSYAIIGDDGTFVERMKPGRQKQLLDEHWETMSLAEQDRANFLLRTAMVPGQFHASHSATLTRVRGAKIYTYPDGSRLHLDRMGAFTIL